MSPPMAPSMKLSLAIARRNVTRAGLDRARADGNARRVEQLEAEIAKIEAQIEELSAQAAGAQLPHRADTDG